MAAPAGRGDGDDSLQYWYWPHRRQITSTNLVPAQQYDTTSPSHYTSHWHTARVEIQSCSGRGQVVESQYWPRPAVDQPIVSKDGHKGRHLLAEKHCCLKRVWAVQWRQGSSTKCQSGVGSWPLVIVSQCPVSSSNMITLPTPRLDRQCVNMQITIWFPNFPC